jgi:hypothetical protein
MNGLMLSLLLLQGTLSIEGTVVQASNQQSVAQTQIVAVPANGQLKDSHIAVSDSAGRFSIGSLAPGSYRVFFEHDGFLRAEYGQRGPGKTGAAVEITAGKNVTGITVSLTAAAAIYGRVINASNDPVIHATVKALKPTYRDGERSLQPVQSVQTNDLGEYRLFGLPPGNYFLSVTPIPAPSIQGGTLTTPSGGGYSVQQLQGLLAAGNAIDPRALDTLTEVTLYAPGTADPAAASAIDLKAGTTYRAPDLRTIRTRTYGISGQVVDDAGQPVPQFSAILTPLDASSEPLRSTRILTGPSPGMEFSRVRPGVYELLVSKLVSVNPDAVISLSENRMALVGVTVGNENIDNLRVVLQPTPVIKGRFTMESGTLPENTRVRLKGSRGIASAQFGATAPDGSFNMNRIPPGDYRLEFLNLPQNLFVRSAKLGARDVSSSTIHVEGAIADQLEIVLSGNTSTVDAFVVDRNKQPSAATTVVLVPDSERRQLFDLYRTATTDSSGRAILTNVAPGSYKLFAWQDIEPYAWQNAEALRPFEDRGAAVSIGENAKMSQIVTVID